MIYTSYFANLRKIPKDIVPVSIARRTPDFFKGVEYLDLAPSEELLSAYKHGRIDWAQYTKDYYSTTLSKLDARDVVDDLRIRTGTMNVVLVCWEGKDKDCHRHLVASWLEEHGFHVEEW